MRLRQKLRKIVFKVVYLPKKLAHKGPDDGSNPGIVAVPLRSRELPEMELTINLEKLLKLVKLRHP